MKVHLRMLGCRLNQAEIDQMARQLHAEGHEIVHEAALADQIIVNTCSVTQEATKSSRKLIRELHRSNDKAQIQVTGCYAQIAPDEIAILPGVEQIVDNLNKDTLVSKMTDAPVETFDQEPISRTNRYPGRDGRTRAFIKVQDGCDNACTFCVTTIARGEGRSRKITEIIDEVRGLQEMGYQEIVLTGVHLGSYGHDYGDQDGLLHLVKALLADTDMPRIRLSSLEPWDLSADFFELWKNARICRHLHLPLQSGCDDTLRRMRRHTTQVDFRSLVEAARERIAGLSITTDVIVGFPGETDDEFAESLAFIGEMNFAGLHVFRYSKRPGTSAARMKHHVSAATKKARSERLRLLSATMERDFAACFEGRRSHVLWEQVTGSSQHGFVNVGYTDNYIRVCATHPRVLDNTITDAEITGYDDRRQQATAQVIIQ